VKDNLGSMYFPGYPTSGGCQALCIGLIVGLGFLAIVVTIIIIVLCVRHRRSQPTKKNEVPIHPIPLERRNSGRYDNAEEDASTPKPKAPPVPKKGYEARTRQTENEHRYDGLTRGSPRESVFPTGMGRDSF